MTTIVTGLSPLQMLEALKIGRLIAEMNKCEHQNDVMTLGLLIRNRSNAPDTVKRDGIAALYVLQPKRLNYAMRTMEPEQQTAFERAVAGAAYTFWSAM